MKSCQKFVLIASPRTGSQALNHHLNQYDGMVMHGEIFNPEFVGLRLDYHEKLDLPRERVELFAHLKRILKLDRLRLRGPNGARDEFHLAATAQNLRKLAKLIPVPMPKPA